MFETNLGAVLQRLHDSEINAGAQAFFDRDWTVWIGDPMNGRVAEHSCESAAEAAAWLVDEAARRFPGSQFAKAA